MKARTHLIRIRLVVPSLLSIAALAALAQDVGPSDGASPPQEPGRIAAKLIVLQASDASNDDLRKMGAALNTMKDVLSAVIDAPTKCISILAPANSEVTAERAIRHLGLAGYAAKVADEDAYTKAKAALRSAPFDVPASVAGTCGTPQPGAPAQSVVSVTSLAESVEPLRQAFNADKGEYRFVALLSPT